MLTVTECLPKNDVRRESTSFTSPAPLMHSIVAASIRVKNRYKSLVLSQRELVQVMLLIFEGGEAKAF